MMKKVVGVVLLICFLFTGCISYHQVLGLKEEKEREKAAQETPVQQTVEVPYVDLEAIFNSYEAEKRIGQINGRDITWGEYFYFYGEAVSEIENIFSYLAGTGYPVSWNDVYQGDMTFAEIPAVSAEQSVQQFEAIESFAAKNGITLSKEAEADIDQQIQTAAKEYCGENATEEDLAQYLSRIYLPLSVYRQMLHTNSVYQQTFTELYGEPTEDGTSEAEYGAKLQEEFSSLHFEYDSDFVLPAVEEHLR